MIWSNVGSLSSIFTWRLAGLEPGSLAGSSSSSKNFANRELELPRGLGAEFDRVAGEDDPLLELWDSLMFTCGCLIGEGAGSALAIEGVESLLCGRATGVSLEVHAGTDVLDRAGIAGGRLNDLAWTPRSSSSLEAVKSSVASALDGGRMFEIGLAFTPSPAPLSRKDFSTPPLVFAGRE